MNKFIKVFLFFTTVVLNSCSSDDVNPPTAGFSLSDENPVQWDKVDIFDQSKESGDIAYEVSGGTYSITTDLSSIVFFEDNSYTLTQIIKNNAGADTLSIAVNVSSPPNTYTLDGIALPINNTAFWYKADNGEKNIRMLTDVEGNEYPNLISLFPVFGTNPIQATYIWSDNRDIGTYDTGMMYNWRGGYNFEWFTNGESGQNLKIELFYEDQDNSDDNAYIITLPSYTLNYGHWDYLLNQFIKEGEKSFSLYYKGKIDPLNQSYN